MIKRKNIQEISDKKLCFGCFLCGDICPTSAIKFEENSEGFFYPQVNDDLCIKCGICYKNCPVNSNVESINYDKPLTFATWCKDEKILKNSSSGGMFSVFASFFLENNGVIYGAAFDENLELKHIRVTSKEDVSPLRGSKYVQSSLAGIFIKLKEDISFGKKILFVGTPCQCAAVKTYFGQQENLFLVDLVCHGVNSPGVFRKYIDFLEHKFNAKILTYSFRDKSFGWKLPLVKAKFSNGTVYSRYLPLDPFYAGYRKLIYVRECCYSCKYAKQQRVGDITLGDFWGVPGKCFNFDGVSLVLVNSSKGKWLFNKIKKRIEVCKLDIETAKKENPQLYKPTGIPNNIHKLREEFFILLSNDINKAFSHFVYGKNFVALRKFKYMLEFFKERLMQIVLRK